MQKKIWFETIFFMATSGHKLQLLLNPDGPLTYRNVRSYLSAIGYKKPGKGLKQIKDAILTYPNCTDIILDLEKMCNIKNSATKTQCSLKKDDDPSTDNQAATDEVVQDTVVKEDEDDERIKNERRLNERLKKLNKTCTGSIERRWKRLFDALDALDAPDAKEQCKRLKSDIN